MILFSSTRLNFYKMSDEHFEDFCRMEMDPEVMKHYTSRKHGSREAALESFKRYMIYMEKHPKRGGFMAFSNLTGEFVGLGVLIHLELNPLNCQHEVGYRLPVKFWGQGYATEIAKTLIEYGFNSLGLKEILGTTNPENIISEKVLIKSGLEKIGTTTHYGGSNLFSIKKK